MGAPLYYDRIEDLLLPVLLRFADVGLGDMRDWHLFHGRVGA